MMDKNAFFKISYGLFLLTSCENGKDNGCIVNTVMQLTDTPRRITVTVNKENLTHDMLLRTGVFTVSVLTDDAPFSLFTHFGFRSGKNCDKFDGSFKTNREENGVLSLAVYTNAVFLARVIDTVDVGTHTLFVADLTDAKALSDVPSLTYAGYFDHVKPAPEKKQDTENSKKRGYVCKICGYVYEGDTLPADFICPICKHGAEDFQPLT